MAQIMDAEIVYFWPSGLLRDGPGDLFSSPQPVTKNPSTLALSGALRGLPGCAGDRGADQGEGFPHKDVFPQSRKYADPQIRPCLNVRNISPCNSVRPEGRP